METLFGEALKGAGGPLVVIILILIAKDFYQYHNAQRRATDDATLAATLKSIADSLHGLCLRIDNWMQRGGPR